MSTFSGLNTALTGLRAQRQGLELAGQNITNANTEGYSRQRVELTAVGGATAAMYATAGTDTGGVVVSQVTRIRDAYLEARGHTEHERQAGLGQQYLVISEIERVFSEPSVNGLQAKLSQLSDGFADVADSPGDSAARTQLLTRASIVTASLNSSATELSGQYTARRDQLTATVDEVNNAAARLAALNETVSRATLAGVSTSELSDQRDLLAMHLVELTGGTVSRGPNNSLNVSIGGSPLVSGITARSLVATGSTTLAGQAGDPVGLRWSDTNTAAGPVGGQIGAQLGSLNTTLPSYLGDLDRVAATLASSVNGLHTTGYTSAGAQGGAFFSGTTAASISVAITDPSAVAVSSSASLALDGGVGDRLAQLGGTAGSADDVYRVVVSRLGGHVQSTEQLLNTQNAITNQVDSARLSSAGVNIDEELTSMLTYQRAYEASARTMSAIDSMLDTLINRTGV
ncbi:flagellar hook-associated protein FlgK [Actinophytocola xanthii]|nr:flagellar hook-associated protein FlgK [Actinophytocola xanthii]